MRWEWLLYALVVGGAVYELVSVRRSIRADREAARQAARATDG